MPTVALSDPTYINATNGAPAYDASDIRRADQTMFAGDGTALGVRSGLIRHGTIPFPVTVNGSDQVTVGAGSAVIAGTGTAGAYRAAFPAAGSVAITGRNATNPRIDLVVVQILDTDVNAAHGAKTARIEVITGTPAASPSAPALPGMALEVGRLTVPAVGGGAVTVSTANRVYTAANGGIIPVDTASQLTAVNVAPRQRAVAIDTGVNHTWDGTAWVPDMTPWAAVTAFQNGWVNFGETDAPAKYRRNGDKLELQGIIKNGTVFAVMFTLPAGFRPAYSRRVPVLSNAALGGVEVRANGDVFLIAGSNSNVSLEGISVAL